MSQISKQTVSTLKSKPTRWSVSSSWSSSDETKESIRTQLKGEQIARNSCLSLPGLLSDQEDGQLMASPLEHLIVGFNSFLLVGYLSLLEEEATSIKSIKIESSSDLLIDAAFFRSPNADAQSYGSIHYTTLINSSTSIPLLRRIHNEVGLHVRKSLLGATGLTIYSKLIIN